MAEHIGVASGVAAAMVLAPWSQYQAIQEIADIFFDRRADTGLTRIIVAVLEEQEFHTDELLAHEEFATAIAPEVLRRWQEHLGHAPSAGLRLTLDAARSAFLLRRVRPLGLQQAAGSHAGLANAAVAAAGDDANGRLTGKKVLVKQVLHSTRTLDNIEFEAEDRAKLLFVCL